MCSTQAEADTAGLKSNSKKTKELQTNTKVTTYINVNNVVTEGVEQFTYLGNAVTVDEEERQDVQMRIVLVVLYPLWKNKNISMNNKIRIFNSNVKSVLSYGECLAK
jgi:hypothetical protein